MALKMAPGTRTRQSMPHGSLQNLEDSLIVVAPVGLG